VVALQLATSGLVLPAQATHIDPERALMNGSLPAPFITPRQVAQIMQAPAKSPASATTAGAKNGKGLASDVISGATCESSRTAAPAAGESSQIAAPAAGESSQIAESAAGDSSRVSEAADSADVASSESTTGEADWSAAADEGQELALNVVPGGVPGTM